jgi:TonB-linked SusC/RagA family outer membrane protein
MNKLLNIKKIPLAMRVTLILLCLIVFQLQAEDVYSQKTKISLDMKNTTIEKVLQTIEEKSDYFFLYNNKLVNVDRKVSVRVKNAAISDILDKLFASQNVEYQVEGNQIILSPKEKAKEIVSLVEGVQQQQKTITGKVTDSNGEPIIGATILIKGTSQGTVTDIDGNYTLQNVPEDAILQFSYVGMETQEIPVRGKTVINVAMKEATELLEEVVVVGYGTQKKINLTGAVGVATEEVLQDRPISNIGQGLQGVIPNLQVNQNNYAPGLGSSFNVRGFTSINEGEPLILVDGVVQDPNLINPNDVESISVLKDAASAAIYGARAAYGVILITTKKGKKEQKPTLNVSSSHSVTSATNIPKYADSWEYITYMNTASKNAGGSNYFDQRLMDHALKYYEDPVNNLPVYYDPAIDTDGKYKYCDNTDWAKELYKNSALSQINANISGGTDKTQYYVSYGFMNQGGFLRSYNDSYKRHNISVNVNTEILDWLTFSVRSRYTYGKEDHPSGGSNGNSGISEYSGQLKNDLRPIMPVKHPDGNWAGQGQFTNPFAVGAEGGYDKRKVNDFWITGAITIKPIKDLNINIDYTYNPYSWNKERTSRLFYEYWAEPGKYNIYPWTSPNLVILENSNDYYQALNGYLDYTKNVNNHNIKFLLGYNHEIKNNKWFYAKRENLIDNDLPAINRAIGEDYVDGSETSWAVQGVFFRINYDFLEKYLLELNGRYDSSSKFPKDDRYSFFPSISGGWRFSEETFWENIKPVVNEAKIRLSYGSLGNQNVASNFPYISDYNINTSMDYILGDERPVGISSGALVSPNFTWEKVHQWNIGGDVGFLENQLTASFDVYRRDTQGMLTEGKPLPAVLGTNVPRENTADLKTYGWESTIEWKQRINEFGYRISFNISDYQSEITKFDNPTGDLNNYYVGRKIGEIWGYHAEGLFQSAQEIENHVSQAKLYGGTWNPGDVKYINLNDDDEISWGTNTLKDHGDLSIIGNNTPRYQYGLILAADWKGFDLNIFFQGIGKRDLWTGNNRFFGIGDEWDVPMKATLDYWTPENSNARLPRPYINGGHGNRYTSTLYLQNGAYLRLKQLTIGYTLPKNLTQKITISKARFYLTGQNLLTLTKLNELYDPENLDLMGYPVPKAFSFGLNLTF